jgi:hypothetical protein
MPLTLPTIDPLAFVPITDKDNMTSQLVVNGWSRATGYADAAFTDAENFIDSLAQVTAGLANLPIVSDELGPVTQVISQYIPVKPPADPTGTTLNLPAVPVEPVLSTVAPLDVGGAPQFTAEAPVVNLDIAVPAPLSAQLPSVPTLTDVIIPAEQPLTLPEVPDLLGVDVPVTPLLTLPTFTAVLPDSPLAPDYIFSFADTTYASGLLTDLRAQLLLWVNGAATGLSPAVEQAIWDQGRARETTNSLRKAQEVLRSFATRGFRKPPGAMSTELLAATQDAQNAGSTLSRDVMIKQADLEQSNRRFAFEQAWKVEEGLITYANQIAQRAFDAARFSQQVAIDIYRETVGRYREEVQAYVAQVGVYREAIQAELTKLEIYKAQLEGQHLIGTLNSQRVDIYRTEVSAAQAIIDVFRAQVEAANAVAGVNKVQIDAYAAQVGAYGETVRAKAAEYEAYSTQVRAEVSKIDVFKAQADAYGSQVSGFRAFVDAQVAVQNAEIKIGQEVPMDLFKSRTEAYRIEVDAEVARVGAITNVFDAETRAFESKTQGEASRVNAEATVYKAESEVAVAAADVRIEAAKANIQTLIQQVTLLVEATKAGAAVSAQLAASALSAVNLHGGLTSSVSNSAGISYSNSVSAGQSSSSSENFSYTQ